MKVPILDLKRQYLPLKEELEKAVTDIMASGMYIMGKTVADFESKMAKYLNVKHVVSTANGTDSLIIALRACGIEPGDEVITTPFTFFATAEAVSSIGAIPVFADVLPDSFNIDPESIKKKITKKTKAILPVHIFGCPADMDQINEIAKLNGLIVIEDACQAIGAEYKSKKTGTLGDMGCFSFFPTKNLGAFGDGGMITTNDDKYDLICRALREHAGGKQGADARWLLQGVKDEFAKEVEADALYNPYKYYNYLIGYNSRLDAMQAAILSIKLDHLDEFNQKRASIAAYYNKNLDRKKYILPEFGTDFKMCWHQYALRTSKKEALGEFLMEKGVASAAFYPVPLHLQKAFTSLGYKEGDFPVAEKTSKETVCLPVFPELTEEELQYVVECVNMFD
jgi:Predicted pyridoxal phosphate-dependent enzyme apparently involved in regulation of cell wall biogenesis